LTVPLRTRIEGVVVEYDDHAGFGEIHAAGDPAGSGGRAERFWFHCTQIADGSRQAMPGQRVSFRAVPGHHGRWEAADITS